MNGLHFHAVRVRSGLTRVDFARALGYTGSRHTLRLLMASYESSYTALPPRAAAAIRDFQKGIRHDNDQRRQHRPGTARSPDSRGNDAGLWSDRPDEGISASAASEDDGGDHHG